MNPQNPVPPSSNPPTPPQTSQPPKPGVPMPPQPPVSPPPPIPITPPVTPPNIPLSQPEVQAVSAGERPLVIPSVNGNSPTPGEVVQVPGGIVFLAWLWLYPSILFAVVLLILLVSVFAIPQSLPGEAAEALGWGIFALIIIIPVTIISCLLFYGFKLLRKWAFILYMVIFILSLLSDIFDLSQIPNLGGEALGIIPGLLVNLWITYYIWSKRSLFISKKEAVARNIKYEAKMPTWGKILFGLFILLPIIAVVATIGISSLVGYTHKNLPIPNSPMASFPPIQKTSSGSGQGTSLSKANDAIRTQDIDSITAALQVHVSTGTCEGSTTAVAAGYYCPVEASWFAGNAIPKDPEGEYFGLPTQPAKTFTVCAQLQNPTGNSSDLNGTPATGASAIYYCKKG